MTNLAINTNAAHQQQINGKRSMPGPRRPGEVGIVWLVLPALWVVLALAGFVFVAYSPAGTGEHASAKVTASPFANTELGVRAGSGLDGIPAKAVAHSAQF